MANMFDWLLPWLQNPDIIIFHLFLIAPTVLCFQYDCFMFLMISTVIMLKHICFDLVFIRCIVKDEPSRYTIHSWSFSIIYFTIIFTFSLISPYMSTFITERNKVNVMSYLLNKRFRWFHIHYPQFIFSFHF